MYTTRLYIRGTSNDYYNYYYIILYYIIYIYMY